MANQEKREGEPLAVSGGKLGDLAFQWADDRYSHKWSFGSEVLLDSDESDGAAMWPASPPLQQIHQQSFADGRQVIFGLGMAGRGHWSASYTLVEDLKCWIVELACKSPVPPESLHSTYRTHGSWTQNDAGLLICKCDIGTVTLEAISTTAVAELSQDSLVIRPSKIDSGASTSQWTFRIRVQD